MMIGSGKNRRSLVFVGNAVDAALSVSGRIDRSSKTYIVTDGIDYSLRDLYAAISRGLGRKASSFYLPRGFARCAALTGDAIEFVTGLRSPFNSHSLEKLTNTFTFSSGRICSELGFRPRFDLYNTMGDLIRWYRVLR
jgi:nucleoside-diphosphate-sugar epimerase